MDSLSRKDWRNTHFPVPTAPTRNNCVEGIASPGTLIRLTWAWAPYRPVQSVIVLSHTAPHIFNCPFRPTELTPADLWASPGRSAIFITSLLPLSSLLRPPSEPPPVAGHAEEWRRNCNCSRGFRFNNFRALSKYLIKILIFTTHCFVV